MNKIFLSILIFFLVVTPSCAASKTPVRIVKILDGDTVRAKINDNIFSIRLIGIDCYETTPNKIKSYYEDVRFKNDSDISKIYRGTQKETNGK